MNEYRHIKNNEGIETRYIINKYGECKNSETNKKIKPIDDGTGRLSLSLWIYKDRKLTKSLAQWMANAFDLKPDDESKTQIDHIDGDKTRNVLDNFEWVTASENVKRAYKTKCHPKSRATITEDLAIKICELLDCNKSPNYISKELNVSSDIVSRIKCGYSWKDISVNYNFINNQTKRKVPIKYSDSFKNEIINLIKNGYTNNQIIDELGLTKNKQLIDLLGNTRRKIK